MSAVIRVLMIFAMAMLFTVAGNLAQGAPRPVDELGLFVHKYGQPDRIKLVAAVGTQRSSKQLLYVFENVRVVFIQESIAGPPRWKLLNVLDLKTNRILSPAEATRKLEKRKKR